MALMADFYLPAGTNLNDFFKDSGFKYVIKEEPYMANNLYIKIENITTSSTKGTMSVSFRKEKDSKILMNKEYQLDITLENNAPNIFEQGYEFLKNKEEFKEALMM